MVGTTIDQKSVKVLFTLLGKDSATNVEELGSAKTLFFGWAYKNAISRVGRRGRKRLALLVTLILLVGFFVVFAAGEAQAQQSPPVAERHTSVTNIEVTRVAHGEAAEQIVETASNEGRGSETILLQTPPLNLASPDHQHDLKPVSELSPLSDSTLKPAHQRGLTPGSSDRSDREVSVRVEPTLEPAPSRDPELRQGSGPVQQPVPSVGSASESADLEPLLSASEPVRESVTIPVTFEENGPPPSIVQEEVSSTVPSTDVPPSALQGSARAGVLPDVFTPSAAILQGISAKGSLTSSTWGATLWATASSGAAVPLPHAASAANALGPLSYGSPPHYPPDETKGASNGEPLEDAPQQPSSPSVPPAGGNSSSLSGYVQAGAGGIGPPLLFVLVSGLILLYPSGRLSSIFCEFPKPSSALLRPLERPG
jgi:hypothetical protein